MGFKEFNILKETLLDVQDLSQVKNNLYSEIITLNNSISTIRKKIKDRDYLISNLELRNTPRNLEQSSRKLKSSKIKLKSLEDKLTAEERNQKKMVKSITYGFVWIFSCTIFAQIMDIEIMGGSEDNAFFIPTSLDVISIFNATFFWVYASLCCFLPMFFASAGALTDDERKSVELKIKSENNEIKSLSKNIDNEIKTLREKNFGLERTLEQKLQNIEEIHNQIRTTEGKINEKMDSISHLIPYADKID
jgi:predicted  nucleic acid-binding Zn-ribbon protein